MNGIINVLKPPGMTSNNVVADLRKLLGIKRVGHMGTLDPGAAGVLPVGVGKGARLFDVLSGKDKTYVAEIAFGVATDTQDAYGAVTARAACTVDEAAFLRALPSFVGERMQTPSVYSAISVGGRKAYQLARAGQEVDLSSRARMIAIYSICYMEQTREDRFLVRVHCSKGTYIRQLAQEIGEALGCPAYLSFLLRTQAGPYRVEDALSIGEIAAMHEAGDGSFLLSAESALMALSELRLDARSDKPLRNGVPQGVRAADGDVRVYVGGAFLGLGRVRDNELRMSVLFDD